MAEVKSLSAGTVIFRYGLAGPPIGATVMMAFAMMTFASAQPPRPGVIQGLLMSGGVLLVAAYIYGVLLAVPTGAVMALLRPRLTPLGYVVTSSLLGALLSGLSMPALAALFGGPTDWRLTATYAAAGAVAALICGWLSRPGLPTSPPV